MKSSKFAFLIFSFIFSLVVIPSFSGTIDYTNSRSLSGLSTGVEIKVKDPHINAPNELSPAPKITYSSKVSYVYSREQQSDLSNTTSWSSEVTYSIAFYDAGFVKQAEFLNKKLKISNGNTSPVYIDIESYSSNFGYAVVTVTGVSNTGTAPTDIRLDLTLSVDREDYLSGLPVLGMDNTSGTIYWSHIPGAERYQLEWVYLDRYDPASLSITTNEAPFRLAEPVRINTSNQYFNPNHTYPEGVVYYRVRAVGKYVNQGIETEAYGNWSYGGDGVTRLSFGINTTSNNIFEKNKTWQYVVKYTEDGSYKKVISYYDGSQRIRQMQTNLSTEDSKAVAESKYDFEGRKVVDILPVPLRGSNLGYVNSFNTFTTTSSLTGKKTYDNGTGPTSLSTVSGASQYYSKNNTYGGINREYVPDAEGYAFTQTEYTRDNTGRVTRQAVAGSELRLQDPSVSSKYTRKFYGSANDTELQRLFGSNVGESKHYSKELSLDPNGQSSVSYKDQEGRVLATALVGNAPASLSSIPSSATATYTVSLNAKNVVDYPNGVSRSVSTILNALPGTDYFFNYDLTGIINKADASYCKSCTYDLDIRFIDPDGIELTSSRITRTDIKPGTTPDCATTPDNYSLSIPEQTVRFNKTGEYTIIKELKLASGAMDILVNEVSYKSDFPQLTTYVTKYVNLIDESSCNITCEDRALAANPTWTLPANQTDVDAWVKTNCGGAITEAINVTADDECESLKGQMQRQLSPGGYIYENDKTTLQAVYNDANANIATWVDGTGAAISKPTWSQVNDPEQFLSSWGINLGAKHPEYCHYNYCVQEKSSSRFDKDMALRKNWTEAALSPNYGDPLATDPYFNGAGLGAGKKAELAGKMSVYQDESKYPQNATDNPDFNKNGIFTDKFSLDQFVKLNTLYNRAPTAEESWNSFRSLYSGMKLTYQVAIRKAGGCSYRSGDDVVVKEPTLPGTESEANSWMNTNMQQHCAGLCTENVNVWVTSLKNQCNASFTSADETSIRTSLTNYCNRKCGFENTRGFILTEDVTAGTDADLNSVKIILRNYSGCSLNLISISNDCKSYTDVTNYTILQDVYVQNALVNEFLERVINETGNQNSTTTNGLITGKGYALTTMNTYNTNWQYFNPQLTPVAGSNNWCDIHYRNTTIGLSVCSDPLNIAPPAPYNFLMDLGTTGTNEINKIRRFKNIRPDKSKPGYYQIDVEFMDGTTRTKSELNVYNYSTLSFYPQGSAVTSSTRRVCNEYEDKTCASIRKLVVSSYCAPGTTKRKWRVSNYNKFALNFEWSISGTTQKGYLTADADGDTYFETTGDNTSTYTAILTVKGVEHSRVSAGYSACSTQVVVTAVPTENPSGVRSWRFTNPTSSDVSIAWSVSGSTQSGTIIAVKNRDTYLQTNAVSGTSVNNLSVPSVSSTAIANTAQTLTYSLDDVNKNCGFTFVLDWKDQKQACLKQLREEANYKAEIEWKAAVDQYMSTYLNQHVNKCFSSPFAENFNYRSGLTEYHYTLYYYDQAGNLVQTVPPDGVDILPTTAFDSKGKYLGTVQPAHRLRTNYKYNSASQVVYQISPDGGETYFWYNDKGQLRLSQNARQAVPATGTYRYSYTRYDANGRLTEAGQIEGWNRDRAYLNNLTNSRPLLNSVSFPEEATYNLAQIVQTIYDVPFGSSLTQENLRGRVSATRVRPTETTTGAQTFYSYDFHGNVKSLVQNVSGLVKRTDYQYDLVSNKVLKLCYQRGGADQFIHAYQYDGDNRLLSVKTSTSGLYYEEDARYFYYPHGPLARVELGQDKVQGVDYYYTLQGWIKGVNTPGIGNNSVDPGQDGVGGTVNKNVSKDEFAYSLGYYNGDYKPVSAFADLGAGANYWNTLAGTNLSSGAGQPKGLFNGNISVMVTDIPELNRQASTVSPILGRVFKYDQLNRLVEAIGSVSYIGTTGWGMASVNQNYYETFKYDPNGNILQAKKYGLATLMDQLDYGYDWSNPTAAVDQRRLRSTNRLYHINDAAPAANYTADIDDQGTYSSTVSTINTANNYGYDEIGNLVRDKAEGISNIEWTVSNKISKITYTTGKTIEFTYDASGNRVEKIVKPDQINNTAWTTEYYFRDANGEILANYKSTYCVHNLTEFPIYGSDRLGVKVMNLTMSSCGGGAVANLQRHSRVAGRSNYELSDHLGNVRVVVTDKKKPILGTGIDGFSFDFENSVPNDNSWGVPAATQADANSGMNSILLKSTVASGFGPNKLINMTAGDKISSSAMMKFTSGAKGGIIVFAFIDAAGNAFKHEFSDAYTLAAHQQVGKWSQISLPEITAPAGTVRASVYLRAQSTDADSYFDDWTIKVTSGTNKAKYAATVQAAQDYYAFGQLMPGRSFSSPSYRYGFNGMEKDDEVKGTGNSYDFGARIYDSRIGRWLATDPLAAKYPDWSPYHGMANNPIMIKDPNGMDWEISVSDDGKGNRSINIKLTAAVINSSTQTINMDALKAKIVEQVETSYTFGEASWNNGKPTSWNVSTTVEVRTINNESDLKNNEHLIQILDNSNSEVNGLYGKVDQIGGTKLYLNAKYIPGILSGADNNTVPHELGHTLGLMHPDAWYTKLGDFISGDKDQYYDDEKRQENHDNAMYSGGSGLLNDANSTNINKEQIESAVEDYNEGDLNQK